MISLHTVIYHAPHADITLLFAILLSTPVVAIGVAMFATIKFMDHLSK